MEAATTARTEQLACPQARLRQRKCGLEWSAGRGAVEERGKAQSSETCSTLVPPSTATAADIAAFHAAVAVGQGGRVDDAVVAAGDAEAPGVACVGLAPVSGAIRVTGLVVAATPAANLGCPARWATCGSRPRSGCGGWADAGGGCRVDEGRRKRH